MFNFYPGKNQGIIYEKGRDSSSDDTINWFAFKGWKYPSLSDWFESCENFRIHNICYM